MILSQTKAPKKPSFAKFYPKKQEAENYFIPVLPANQHWIDFLSNQPEGEKIAKKIYDVLTYRESDKSWGLSIPKKMGISAAERIMISGKSEAQSQAALAYNQLILNIFKEQEFQIKEEKIKAEDKLELPEIGRLVSSAMGSIANLSEQEIGLITPHLKAINEIADRLDSLHENIPKVSHLLRTRVISDWQEEDTAKIHDGMFVSLVDIFRQEENYRSEEKEGNPTKA